MSVTISTHNGSAVSREHNIRNRNVTDAQPHINPDKPYEIWHDEKIRHAYHRLFGKSVRDYNAKQTREDRKITNYYKKICDDKKKHPAYEMIIAIGNRENYIDEPVGRLIMKKFVDTWKDRNPNLEMIGAYYHADEEGVPHCHIDYIPVANGYKNGMETQTGLVKAFEQMGIVKDGKETAQIQWERQQNEYLEYLCNSYGIKIEHPDADAGLQHLDTRIYQAQKELDKLEEQIMQAEFDLHFTRTAHDSELERLAHIQNELSFANAEIKAKTEQKKLLEDNINAMNKRLNNAETRLQTLLSHAELLEKGLAECDEAERLLKMLNGVKELLPHDFSEFSAEKAEELRTVRTNIQKSHSIAKNSGHSTKPKKKQEGGDAGGNR